MNRSSRHAATSNEMQTDEYVPVFYEEISNIMRGLGDCESPLRESVILMEKVLLQQLQGIVQEAVYVASPRYDKKDAAVIIHPKDIFFLMRKNRTKVQQLLKYLRENSEIQKLNLVVDSNSQEAEFMLEDDNSDSYIADIDTFYDMNEPCDMDDERLRRMQRANRISQMLDGKKYQEYALARRTSFCGVAGAGIRSKLRDWIMQSKEIRLMSTSLNALSFLAQDTVARVVDLALLTRLDAAKRGDDLFVHLRAGNLFSPVSVAVHDVPDTSMLVEAGVRPISVAEINEALRRFNMPSKRSFIAAQDTRGPRLIAIT